MKKLLAVLALIVASAGMAQAQHSATLTWGASTPGTCAGTPTLAYNVFRGTTAGGEGTTPLNATPLTVLTFSDTTVALGTTYFYKVQATEVCGNFTLLSAFSNEVTAIFPSAPTAPVLQPPVTN